MKKVFFVLIIVLFKISLCNAQEIRPQVNRLGAQIDSIAKAKNIELASVYYIAGSAGTDFERYFVSMCRFKIEGDLLITISDKEGEEYFNLNKIISFKIEKHKKIEKDFINFLVQGH